MGVGRAQHDHVELARRADVSDIAAVAGQEAAVLDSAEGRAEAYDRHCLSPSRS